MTTNEIKWEAYGKVDANIPHSPHFNRPVMKSWIEKEEKHAKVVGHVARYIFTVPNSKLHLRSNTFVVHRNQHSCDSFIKVEIFVIESVE